MPLLSMASNRCMRLPHRRYKSTAAPMTHTHPGPSASRMPDEYGPVYCMPLTVSQVSGKNLPGIIMGRRSRPTSAVAYAVDVTIFVSSVADFPVVEEAHRLFERASGASINP